MLYGSETWCLRENEMAILRRTKKAMMRAMWDAKLMEKKWTEDLMEILGLKETVVQMAKANGVRWYRHVFRRDDRHVLRKALEFEVKGKRKQQQPKKTWKTQVEDARVLVWRRRITSVLRHTIYACSFIEYITIEVRAWVRVSLYD